MLNLITYDLKRPVQDYVNLHNAIKEYGTWWHYLESTWVIKTTQRPQEVYQNLRKHIDDNDRIFIVNITNQQRQGWMPKAVWDWLKENEA